MGAASGMKLSDLTEEMIENSPLWDMDLNVSQLQLPQSVLCNDNALSFVVLGLAGCSCCLYPRRNPKRK